MTSEAKVNKGSVLEDFKQSRMSFLALCHKRNLLNGDIGFLTRWWKNTRKSIERIDRELAAEYESLGWQPMKELEFPKFITEYQAGHPGLKRLGWEIVGKAAKYETEFEEVEVLNQSLTEECEQLGNTLNDFEVRLNKTIGYVPTDIQMGIRSAY